MNKKKNLKKIFAASLTLAAGISLVSCRDSKAKNYTVSFSTDGGTVYNDTTITKGKTVDLTQYAPTKDGYVFEGWYTDDAFTTAFTSETKVTGDLTLYAKWVKAINVTFESNGGSAVTKAVVAKGKTVTRPADPTKEAVSSNHKTTSYTFAGWFTDEKLETEYNFSTAVEADFKLYAKWTESVAIDEGYEAVKVSLDLEALKGAGTLAEDYVSGAFTVQKGCVDRNGRAKTWKQASYDDYPNLDLYATNEGEIDASFTNSVKVDNKNGIAVKALGNGVIKFYIQNGSGGATTQFVTLTTTPKVGEATTEEIEFPGTTLGSPVVQLCVDAVEGNTYTLTRPSGTVDVYYVEQDVVAVESPVASIAITKAGTQNFISGQEFNYDGLVVNAIKENGATVALDNSKLTVTHNATDFTVGGTYTVTVKYGEFEATYDVNVASLSDISLKFNKVELLKTNTFAGNGQYFNQTVQQVYKLNDTLDKDALSIYAEDDQGTVYSIAVSDATFNDVDMTTAGVKTVTVTVTLNGITKTAEYTIYVVDTAVQKQTIDGAQCATVYVDKNYTGVIGAAYETASNGTCNAFTTIQQALDYLGMQDLAATRKIVYIADGTYNEKLELTLPYLELKSVSGNAANCIIEYDSLFGIADDSGFVHVTDSTQTVAVRDTAINCIIDGITISNYYNDIQRYADTSYGVNNGERALALLVQADQFIMQNGRLLGWQDTVELFTGRQYFFNTYISGCVDYIFGTNNTTYFYQCEIHTKKGKANITDNTKVAAYLTAFKGCNKGDSDAITYGAIFNDCNFTADSDFVGKIAVGRNWGKYAAVTIMNSKLCDEVVNNANEAIVAMNGNNNNISTIDYNFYNNTASDGETAWTLTENIKDGNNQTINHTLTATEAANYSTYAVIFGKTNNKITWTEIWDPTQTGVKLDDKTYYYFNGGTSATGTVYQYNTKIGDTGNPTTGTLGGLTIDATAGKLHVRTSDTQWNAGTTISLDVTAGTEISVTTYPGYHGYKVSGSKDTTVKLANADTVNYYFAEAQTVTFTATSTAYLYSIIVNPDEAAPVAPTISEYKLENTPVNDIQVGTDLDLSDLEVYAYYSDNTIVQLAANDDYTVDTNEVNINAPGTYTVTVNIGTTEKTFTVKYVSSISDTFEEDTYLDFDTNKAAAVLASNKITLSADFAYNNNNYTQITAGTFSFKVKAGAIVTVVDFGQGYGYISINGESTNSAGTTVIEATDDMTIAIGAVNVGTEDAPAYNKSYLKSINISYPAPAVSASTTWSFNSSDTTENDNYYVITTAKVEGTVATIDADNLMTVDATTGKLADNGGTWYQFNNTTKISFNVSGACTVKVNVYQGSTIDVKLDGGDAITGESDGATHPTYTYAISAAGEVTITSTVEKGYIGKIEVIFA